MRSIESSFRKIEKKNPSYGDYPCMVEAVMGRGFNRRAIREAFKKLIDKDDYDSKDLNKLITQLHIISNVVVDDHFKNKIARMGYQNLFLDTNLIEIDLDTEKTKTDV